MFFVLPCLEEIPHYPGELISLCNEQRRASGRIYHQQVRNQEKPLQNAP